MTYLVFGLVLFLGVHSIRICAADWRQAQIAARGEKQWKMLYSLVSAVGLALIVWGYSEARGTPIAVWQPAPWTRPLAALLTLPAFILLAATYVPANRTKAKIGHPMVAAVKLWAFAHLLSNGNLADLLLFGSFLLWAIASFRAARGRDRAEGVVRQTGPVTRDIATIMIGISVWAGFSMFLHLPLIGVRPY